MSWLSTRVDLWYDSKWNNVTSAVLADFGIEVERGWSGEDGSGVDPSTCRLAFKSTDGTYSPANPESALYGKIGKNTPIRVGCGTPPVGAASTGSGGTTITAPSVTAEATGVQVVFAMARPGGNLTTPGTFTAGVERDGTLSTSNSFRKTGVTAGATGTVSITHSTTLTGWAACNVHVPGATSASVLTSSAVTTGDSANSSFAPTGDYLLCCVAWSSDVFDRSMPPEIDPDLGRGWQLIADTGVSSSDTVPRMTVWGMPLNGDQTDAYIYGALDGLSDQYICYVELSGTSDWSTRFTGYVSEWPQRWDPAEALVTVPVVASGVTRRLSRNSSAISPVRASNLTRNFVEYWPMEEDTGAESFANLITGGAPMTFAGTPVLSGQAIQGSGDLPTFTGAGAQAPVREYSTVPDQHGAVCIFRCPESGTTAGANILQMQFEGGTFSSLHVEYTSSTVYTLKLAYNDGGVTLSGALSTLPDSSHGRVFLVVVSAYEGTGSGPIVSAAMVPLDTNTFDASKVGAVTSSPLGGDSVGRCTRVTVGLEGGTGSMLNTNAPAMGHVGVIAVTYPTIVFGTTGDPYAFGVDSIRGLWGWARELASYRLTRLARANGVKLQGTYYPDTHGAAVEPTGPILERFRDAADASPGAQLYEASGFPGYVFKHHLYLEREPRLAVPYTSITGSLEPTDDEANLVNAVTASSSSGNVARYEDTDSVEEFGLYEKGLELGLFTAAALGEAAAWAVHLGTVGDMRFPVVAFDLRTQAALQEDAYLWLDVGDRIEFTGVPPFAGADTTLLIRGMREQIWPHGHYVTLVCAPGEPWRVAVADGDYFVGDDGEVILNEDLTTGEVGVDYLGTLHDPASPADYYYATVAGEVWQVADTAGTMLVSRSQNGVVKAQSTGARIEIVAPYAGY